MCQFEPINFSDPLSHLIFWGLSLHGVWEFFQCLFFYDMTGFGSWKGALWMIGATVADVILTLFLVGGALWLQSRKPYISFVFTLTVVGLLVAIGIESLASLGQWWRYTPAMPQLPFAGVTLGLSPILQMALLPYLIAKLAHVNPPDR